MFNLDLRITLKPSQQILDNLFFQMSLLTPNRIYSSAIARPTVGAVGIPMFVDVVVQTVIKRYVTMTKPLSIKYRLKPYFVTILSKPTMITTPIRWGRTW